MKKGISREVKIGVAFIIALGILYFGISFLKGVNIFKPANSYYVAFDDVTDLTVSSPVFLKGFQIGLLYSMELDPQTNKVIAVLNLNKGIKIPKGSELRIDGSMLGGAKILLVPAENTGAFYTTEDTIPGKRPLGMMESVSGLIPQVSDLLPKIDSILTGLQTVVNHPGLTNSIDNADKITTELEKSTKQLSHLLAAVNNDVPKITSNLANASQNVSDLTAKAKAIDLNSINVTLKNIQTLSERINSKDNSIGLLMNDRQLYDSITTTLNNASLLLKDVKENPSRYINVKVF